ncbi:hypothetical protein [Agrococcus sp. TF02-05]|uniref:hypothetical protein n=1 Tax=Agrococcus sp. TF02-05 TaxID=2815211 RepID=UPI001AA1C4CD|nr:hypothetical protein [Agrococcus sp. TF02-05]MBO1769447.1 hypothetical protein [Agrococcus sp. TF02-05]
MSGQGAASESAVGYAERADASTSSSAQGAAATAAEAIQAVQAAAPGELNAGEPGVPLESGASLDDVLRLGAVAVWIEEPTLFAVSVPAAQDCWPSAGEPVAIDGSALVVAFLQGDACATPTAARTYRLEVPEEVDADAGLDLAVVGLGEEFALRLPAS